ncbi:MAG: hypothetical protein EXQ70_02160 [Solirubrobacterales bacterium]|nr:hypothetical protein [Solirubrobacterales bacterium]
MAGQRLIDWGLAERIALALAGEGPSWDGARDEQLRVEAERAARLVSDHTGLKPANELPPAELVGRDEWARVNLESFRSMSAGIESRLSERMRSGGGGWGVPRAIGAAATGAEIGLATGYLAQRVIGQYDVALIGPARAPRLLFVAPNLAAARQRLGVDRELFLRWIALHEATHAVQFSSVPWLRDQIGSIAAELLESAGLEISPRELLSRLSRFGVRELVRSATAGELASLFWNEDQERLVDRLISAMTVVEGYAEHVMDAVGERLDPRYGELRRRLDCDRGRRGPLDAVVSRLLGLEIKMNQYRQGKAFSDEIVRLGGIRTLNQVWLEPAALPTASELEHPGRWLERVGPAPVGPRRLVAWLRQAAVPAA